MERFGKAISLPGSAGIGNKEKEERKDLSFS
jgi:hypothetical protein